MSNLKLNVAKVLKKLHLSNSMYKIAKNFSKAKKLEYDYDYCYQKLNEYSPRPIGNVDGNNKIINKDYDLYIIVAVYNNEQYTRQCLESLENQKTKYKYLCYVIDDGSTDNSYYITDEYKDKENFVVIHQENMGASGSRNTGLSNISGKYLMFVDGDDYIAEDCVEKLLDYAYENDADIVDGSFISLSGDKQFPYQNKKGPCDYLALSGFQWLKVIKSELFLNSIFPKDYWFEDTIMSFLIYPLAEKIYQIDDYVFYHNINEKGLIAIAKGKPKSVDTYWISELCAKARLDRKYPCDENYWRLLRRQFINNYKRTYLLPDEIKEYIFVLEKKLLLEAFPNKLKEDEFMNCFYDNDYNRYHLYAYWYGL